MRITYDQSIALVIDIQERLFPHMQESSTLLDRTVRLLKGLQVIGIPFIITEQYPKGLGATIPEIAQIIPDFNPVEKISFSCCDDDVFIQHLNQLNRKIVIIAGIEAHVCVLQTATDLIAKGFIPVIVEDCTSSRFSNDKLHAIERMKREGAIISTMESILFELTRKAGTDTFKSISKIVK